MSKEELKEDLIYDFRKEVDKRPILDTFVDKFDEFIGILAEQDLSEETIRYLYDIFIKDMNGYFKNKQYEKENSNER